MSKLRNHRVARAFLMSGLALLLSGCIKQRYGIVDTPPPPAADQGVLLPK
jgi:hypothetical protein